jgi:citrate lyase beta subunit
MVAAYEEAVRQGLGSVAIDGVMVDAVIFRANLPIIAKADAIGI